MKIHGDFGAYNPVWEDRVAHTIDDVEANVEEKPFHIRVTGEAQTVKVTMASGAIATITNFANDAAFAVKKVHATGTDTPAEIECWR